MMKLTITPDAAQWFRQELLLNDGDSIRFLGKVYGKTEVHEGFSVGISMETPKDPLIQTIKQNTCFFIEKQDAWFFERYDLTVGLDSALNEPAYHFNER